jgi:DNA-binding PadR family transcriptional regulator
MPMDGDADELLAGHVQELRRGTVVMACLALLQTPTYGYALLTTLEGHGLRVDANTLYPLLRRLESQGLLSCEWNTEESRPRKFYACTPEGRTVLAGLRREWGDLAASLGSLEEEDAS